MEEFKNNKKICSHIHVPVQCPNDEILKAMNRKYTLDEYKKKIDELRDAREDVNITTDLIVGFPGETEEIFNSMLDECVKIGFSKIHTFPYSLRKGTKASLMKQVKDSDKTDRTDKMLRLSDQLESNYYKKYLGKTVSVLVEKNNSGFTSNYIKVHFDKDIDEGNLVDVKITKVDGINVYGEVI
jgi:threonylcarbamoyladenosine tRNA methylthiotransferase MtaB